MTTNDAVYLEDVDIGDEVPAQLRQIFMEDVRPFMLAWHGPNALEKPSRFNSVEYALSEGLPTAILPGIMNMALVSKMLTDWSHTVRLKSIDVIFRQVVPQGAELKIYAIITDKHEDREEIEVDLYLEPAAEGQPYVRGSAVLGLPSRGS